MVAYSFKERFVAPIRAGLGLPHLERFPPTIACRPKRQTIRAGFLSAAGVARSPKGKRHAKVGDDVQLYWGQRTKSCTPLGTGRCVALRRVTIWVDVDLGLGLTIMIDGKILGPRQANDFARSDGFAGIIDMGEFWFEEHGPGKFEGVVICWEPRP